MARKRKPLRKGKQSAVTKRIVAKTRTRTKQSTKPAKKATRETKRKVSATARQIKKTGKQSRRKIPKLAKTLKRKAPKKKEQRPLFRKTVIHGTGGELVKIMEPIGYRDYRTRFRRLLDDPRYKLLRREYPYLTYSIFGHPGHHKLPTLEALLAWFETVYAPTLKASQMRTDKRTEFFANLVIYGVKRGYKVAPATSNAHGKRRRQAKARRI